MTDAKALNRTRLLYRYTKGIVRVYCDGGKSLELYIPVLDFAWCLLQITKKLEADDQGVFEFTESHYRILFRKSAVVVITTDYSDWSCQCSYEEFQRLVADFAQTFLDDLCDSVPEIAKHSLVEEAYAKLQDNKCIR